jgi:CMP-N,N'-diacetyllegionaminic acid synthase
MDRNILVVICARKGSKGVKGKNIREFRGYPIAYYTLSAYSLFTERYLSDNTSYTLALNTDSDTLKQQFAATNLEYMLLHRKESLAGDRVSKVDVIRDSLTEAEHISGYSYDLVIDLDITSPLRKAADIAGIVDVISANEDADIALSVTEARRNPYFNQLKKDEDGFLNTVIASDFIARQQSPEVFDANASVYCYRPSYLKDSDGIFLNARLVGSFMEDTGILDIDSSRDFELMELIAGYLYETTVEYGEIRANIKNILRKEG